MEEGEGGNPTLFFLEGSKNSRVCFFMFFDINILDPSMDAEKDIPMKYTSWLVGLSMAALSRWHSQQESSAEHNTPCI